MKNKNKSKEYEVIYTCDFCNKEFSTKKEASKHELVCNENPENKDVMLTITSNKFITICITLFFLYISTYFVANVNAQSNGNSTRDLLKPQNWFPSEKKNTDAIVVKITPTSIPTSIPTIKPNSIPKIQSNTTSSNNSNQIECIGPDGKHFNTSVDECKKLNEKWGKSADYTVDCSISSNCGGGTKKLLKSECDNSTCCQIGDKWIFYTSKSKCNQDQKNNSSGSNGYTNTNSSSSYPPCTVYYPILGYSRTYYYTPPEQCQLWQQQASSVNKTPTPYATPTMTEAQAQSIINSHNSQVQQCRNQVNTTYSQKMQNCNIQFQGSAAEVCTTAVQKQWNQATSNCGQLY